ncbi:MAG: hypothetical protein ABID04_01135 [Patescibacteria group bacterium]
MKRLIVCLLVVSCFFFASWSWAEAEENNKFGIHLAVASEEDLLDAAKLVNSSGGDWGYLTLVIQENDRDPNKWQAVFDQMRELHLVPIVRLATFAEGGYWHRPSPEDASGWAEFLNSLNWVVKNRYVILFNEPNHASEWGGEVDIANYRQVSEAFVGQLREASPDFFVMLAGLDAAAPGQMPNYGDELAFLKELLPLYRQVDGLASHSYPNHGYIGSPNGRGRNSVRTYQWELDSLKQLGLEKDLPVFITETGWPHSEGINRGGGFYNAQTVAKNFEIYFANIVVDPRVLAITPFLFNYQGEPFDHFSWRRMGSQRDFYPQYYSVQGLKKVAGQPKQEQKMSLVEPVPAKLIKNSSYKIPIVLSNVGQAIWKPEDGYQMSLIGDSSDLEYFFSDFVDLKPGRQETVYLHLKVGDQLGKKELAFGVGLNGQVVSNSQVWDPEIIPPISLDFKVRAWPEIKKAPGYKIVIYNDRQEVVFEKDDIGLTDNWGRVDQINNLLPGQEYRLVLVRRYYLPRQEFFIAKEGNNQAKMKPMLGIDLTGDGQLGFSDWALALARLSLWLKALELGRLDLGD